MLCETLRDLLVEKDLSQADLSRATGIPTSLISNYLSGKKSPSLTNSILLANALHVTLDELAGVTKRVKNNPSSEVDAANDTSVATDIEDDLLDSIRRSYSNVNREGQKQMELQCRLIANADEYQTGRATTNRLA